jgi:hypothetical protein
VTGGGNDLVKGAADASVLNLAGLSSGSQFNIGLIPTSLPPPPSSAVTYTLADFSASTAGVPIVLPTGFSGTDLTSLFSFNGFFATTPTVALVGGNMIQVTFTPVPEPTAVFCVCAIGAGLVGWRRRRAARS